MTINSLLLRFAVTGEQSLETKDLKKKKQLKKREVISKRLGYDSIPEKWVDVKLLETINDANIEFDKNQIPKRLPKDFVDELIADKTLVKCITIGNNTFNIEIVEAPASVVDEVETPDIDQETQPPITEAASNKQEGGPTMVEVENGTSCSNKIPAPCERPMPSSMPIMEPMKEIKMDSSRN